MDPSAGTGNVPVDAIIQHAMAMGIQPHQLLQLLSNQNSGVLQQIQQQQAAAQQAQQQQQQQVAAQQAATSAQNFLLSQLPPNLHAVLSQQQAAQQNPALLIAQQQALANQQAALAAAQQQAQVQAQQRQKAEQQQPMMSSLAWPEHNPAVQIPHFDSETYKRVNIDISYSAIPSGMDLPINNVDTLRFFFNFGVNQARAILEKLATRGNNSQPLPQNLTNTALLKSISLQAAAQEQRGALAGIQQQTAQTAGTQQIQAAALSNPSSSMSTLQQSLIQHMNRIGNAAGQSQMKMNDVTEAMMLQSALMNPSLAQLRSQSSASHVLIPPSSSLASNIQNQLSGLQAPHPLEHELIRPTPVNHLATVAAAAVASAGNNVSSIATSLQAHAALNALQRSSNASTPNPVPSTAGSISAGTPLSNGGIFNSSSPKVSIPVDPAPRKPSAVAGHPEIADLQQRGLMALRSPSLMSEGLQRSLAAVDAAYNGGNSITVTSNNASSTTTNSTEQTMSTGNSNLNDKITAPLGAQLSAALCQSYIDIANDNRSGTQTPNISGNNSTPGSSGTPTTGLGGIGIATTLAPGGKSITTGSAGIDQKSASIGYPTVMEVDGTPIILQASETHFTETLKKNPNFLPTTDTHSSPQAESRRKSGLYALTPDVKEEKKDIKAEKPLVPMMNYVNNCLKEVKTHLHSQGVGVALDTLGKPVDYASRPIDPIFREARQSLDRMNPYNEIVASTGINFAHLVKNQTTDSSATSSVSNCLIGIAGAKSEPSTSGTKDDDQSKSNGHASHAVDEGEVTEEERKKVVSQSNNGRSASPEEIDVCGDTKPSEKRNHGREEDLSSPDEKRLRIASASDDE